MTHEWYITFHGGTGRGELNNIHVYSAEGRALRKALDHDRLPSGLELRELRGHAFGPDGSLYVANAFHDYSQVLRFYGKANKHGQHAFQDVFVQSDAAHNPGLIHPFNLVFSEHGDLYVSSQGTNLVLRYHGPTSRDGAPGTPIPPPAALAEMKDRTFSPGTFCASARDVADGLQTVREALFVGRLLYVSDRDADCIRQYDRDTGAYRGAITARGLIDKPIQLAARGDTLYIGNRGSESVVQCDLRSGQVAPFIKPKAGKLKNPAGLAIGDDGFFYVASRGTLQILRYRLTDGHPDDRPFIDDLEDEPEFIESVSV